MTHKLGRIHLLGAAAAMIAILALGIITAAWAQMNGQRQPFGKPVDASPQLAKAWQGPPVHFGKAVGYDTAGDTQARLPQMVAVGDLNGDGVTDVAVASMCQPLEGNCYGQDMDIGAISVLLGNGDGTLQPPVVYQSGGYDSFSVVVADLNGDGRPDLVFTNYCQDFECTLNGSVGVLMNGGSGFWRAVYDSGGPDAYTVAVGDVNGDGKPDIVVANLGSLGVLLGNGNGSFQAAVTYGTGASWANSVVVADVNGDGKPDIVVANSGPDSVGVLLGNGDGTFQPAVLYSSGGRTDSVAVADLNGDGKPDIVATNGDNSVGVLLGNGDGTFQTATVYSTGGLGPVSVAVADVNGDGYPDIVVVGCTNCFSTWDGVAEVLLGKGDGTFRGAVSYGEGAGTGPMSVALGDLNGDGKLDIVVANQYTNTVGVLLNNSGFATTTLVTSSVNPSVLNQPVTFTATVTSKRGAILDGDLVTFYDGKTVLGSVALAGGVASYSTSSLAARTHYIKATYAGDTTLGPSTGRLMQVVDKYPTTTALTSSPNPSAYGQAVTFTATVTPSGPYMPTGKVKFMDVGVLFGSATLSGGVATLTYSKLLVGTHTITAQYVGDDFSAKSTSSALNQRVK